MLTLVYSYTCQVDVVILYHTLNNVFINLLKSTFDISIQKVQSLLNGIESIFVSDNNIVQPLISINLILEESKTLRNGQNNNNMIFFLKGICLIFVFNILNMSSYYLNKELILIVKLNNRSFYIHEQCQLIFQSIKYKKFK